MKKEKKIEMFVNSNPFETRVAITEDGSLAELYVERPEERKVTGNVYKGRVARVLPGMQSAFINVGLARTAFLHASRRLWFYHQDGMRGGLGAGP